MAWWIGEFIELRIFSMLNGGVNLRQSTCHFTIHWRNINGLPDKNSFAYSVHPPPPHFFWLGIHSTMSSSLSNCRYGSLAWEPAEGNPFDMIRQRFAITSWKSRFVLRESGSRITWTIILFFVLLLNYNVLRGFLILKSISQCLSVFTNEQVGNLLIHVKQYPPGDIPFAYLLGAHPLVLVRLLIRTSMHGIGVMYSICYAALLFSLFIISPIIYSLFKFLPLSIMFSTNNKIFIHPQELLHDLLRKSRQVKVHMGRKGYKLSGEGANSYLDNMQILVDMKLWSLWSGPGSGHHFRVYPVNLILNI